MKNLQPVIDYINEEMTQSYHYLLSTEAQDFISRHKTFRRFVEVHPENERLDVEFNAAMNTLTHMWSQFLLTRTQAEIFSVEHVIDVGLYKRFRELCDNMNEDVKEFIKVARVEVT